MAVSLEVLKAYVNEFDSENDAALLSALETATDILDDVLSQAFKPVPESVYDRLVLEVSHEFYKRKDSVSGASQYAEYSTGQPVMGPRDPLQRQWPVIRRYVLAF